MVKVGHGPESIEYIAKQSTFNHMPYYALLLPPPPTWGRGGAGAKRPGGRGARAAQHFWNISGNDHFQNSAKNDVRRSFHSVIRLPIVAGSPK